MSGIFGESPLLREYGEVSTEVVGICQGSCAIRVMAVIAASVRDYMRVVMTSLAVYCRVDISGERTPFPSVMK